MTSASRSRATPGKPAGRPGIAYVREVFSRMYPDAEVSVGTTSARGSKRSWACLPNAGDPWLLVPLRSRAVTRSALGEIGRRGHHRAEQLARVGAAIGGLHLVPKLIVATGGDEDIEGVIARSLSCSEVSVGMVVGKTRALQKPVLRVFDRSGATIAFAKVGVSAPTRELVRRETRVLQEFQAAPPRFFATPRVLGADEWRGLTILLQQPMAGDGVPVMRDVIAAAREITRRGDVTDSALADSAAWRDLRHRLERLAQTHEIAVRLADTAMRVEQQNPGTRMRTGRSHGDFTPWNVASTGTSIDVWDWEGCVDGLPAGFDLLHYRFQEAVVVRGGHPRLAFADLLREAPSILAPWAPADPRLIVTTYLMHVAATALETGDTQARISRLSEWVPDALTDVRSAGVHS